MVPGVQFIILPILEYPALCDRVYRRSLFLPLGGIQDAGFHPLGCWCLRFAALPDIDHDIAQHPCLTMKLAAGFIIAVIIAFAAYRARSLSRSGALAAVVVGTVIFGIGGWQWAVLLLTFFITSSCVDPRLQKTQIRSE